ncbi:hypothetical protein MN608_07011 [Microdochium nivale]|nr:hypothetical protein MN608_07011 [Microdochium nivale]
MIWAATTEIAGTMTPESWHLATDSAPPAEPPPAHRQGRAGWRGWHAPDSICALMRSAPERTHTHAAADASPAVSRTGFLQGCHPPPCPSQPLLRNPGVIAARLKNNQCQMMAASDG